MPERRMKLFFMQIIGWWIFFLAFLFVFRTERTFHLYLVAGRASMCSERSGRVIIHIHSFAARLVSGGIHYWSRTTAVPSAASAALTNSFPPRASFMNRINAELSINSHAWRECLFSSCHHAYLIFHLFCLSTPAPSPRGHILWSDVSFFVIFDSVESVLEHKSAWEVCVFNLE